MRMRVRVRSHSDPAALSIALRNSPSLLAYRSVRPDDSVTGMNRDAYPRRHSCRRLSPTNVGNRNFCRRYLSATPSGRERGGWAWLISISLAVIGRLSKNVSLQFGAMSATNVDAFFVSAKMSVTFVGSCEQV